MENFTSITKSACDQRIDIHFLESIWEQSDLGPHATGEISLFYLVSVAEETDYLSDSVRNPEDMFCHVEAHITY